MKSYGTADENRGIPGGTFMDVDGVIFLEEKLKVLAWLRLGVKICNLSFESLNFTGFFE